MPELRKAASLLSRGEIDTMEFIGMENLMDSYMKLVKGGNNVDTVYNNLISEGYLREDIDIVNRYLNRQGYLENSNILSPTGNMLLKNGGFTKIVIQEKESIKNNIEAAKYAKYATYTTIVGIVITILIEMSHYLPHKSDNLYPKQDTCCIK